MVARVFMALAAGVAVVTALTLAMKIAPAERAGRAIATVVTGFTASLILGVPAGRLVAEWFSWQTVFLGIAVATLLAAGTLRYALPPVGGDRPVPVSRQLALLKNPAIVRGLSITFFWLGGYSVAYTYLSPYLIEVSGVPATLISGALTAFGIASLVGSKAGGFLTDRRGVLPTLLGGMGLHLAALVALSFVSGSMILVLAVLVIWSVAAWSTGPTQQFHLATIEPEASGILLGLNQSMMQLAMAAGAGLGGLTVAGLTLESVSWIGRPGSRWRSPSRSWEQRPARQHEPEPPRLSTPSRRISLARARRVGREPRAVSERHDQAGVGPARWDLPGASRSTG